MVDLPQYVQDGLSIAMSSDDSRTVYLFFGLSYLPPSSRCVNICYVDPIFRAVQDIAFNAKLIEKAEATVLACEQELQVLRKIGFNSVCWWKRTSATGIRAKYLMEKMANAQATLQKLEKESGELRKVLQ